MKKINFKKGLILSTPKGFSLIELMVVVAIVAILAAITMGYLGSARKKGGDTGAKSNLATVRALSEIFYLDNNNSYFPAGGVTFGIASCPSYDVSGTNMFSQDKNIAKALAQAIDNGNGSSSCANSADFWAIAVGLNLDTNTSWCIDNAGIAKKSSYTASNAINPLTFACN